MAEGFGIAAAAAAAASAAGAPLSARNGGPSADLAAAKRPSASGTTPAQATPSIPGTSYSPEPVEQPTSRLVARLMQQQAQPFAPGLARVVLPSRAVNEPRPAPRKPAGPMIAPRSLDGGRSPLATSSLWDARRSIVALGVAPSSTPGVA